MDNTKQLRQFVGTISRMKTEEEFGNDAPPSEDWISTLNDLIMEARRLGRYSEAFDMAEAAIARVKEEADANG